MTVDYTVMYRTPGYNMVSNLQFSKLEITRKENDIGTLTLTLPPAYYVPGFFRPEGIIEVYRSFDSWSSVLETGTFWLIRRIHYATDGEGAETLVLDAYDLNSILKRRVIAYDRGTVYADKLDVAETLMKDIVRENFGDLVFDPDGTGRDLSDWISVAASGDGGAITGGDYSWRNVLDVLAEIEKTNEENDIRMVFGFYPDAYGKIIFRTYRGFSGVDHSQSGPRPLLFGLDYGNLSEPELILDFVDELNFITAAGTDDADTRIIKTASDAARLNWGPYARTEGFIELNKVTDADQVQAAADSALIANRPRLLFTGKILETGDIRYERDFNYGDLVTAQYKGYSIPCRLDTISIEFSNEGEKIDLTLHGEAFL